MDNVIGRVRYGRPVAPIHNDTLSIKSEPRSVAYRMDELPPLSPTQGSSRDAIGYLRNVDDFEFVNKLGEGFFGYGTSYAKCTLVAIAHI
jgi:hypothetical protein